MEYNKNMNRKSIEERAKIIHLLVEGNSLRATARLADVAYNTVLKLLVDVGNACLDYQGENLVDLPCKRVQVDELYSFVGCNRRSMGKTINPHPGDVWIWTSLCADTKIMPNFMVGDRTKEIANLFIMDLSSRMRGRIQLTSDGFGPYRDAVESVYGDGVDFGMLVKQYSNNPKSRDRYMGAIKTRIIGNPDPSHISTSYIERSNLTLRMGCRRFARKTNAFSKKIENHTAALGLHFMYYNFVRVHSTLRVTPAMDAGLTDRLWSCEDIARL